MASKFEQYLEILNSKQPKKGPLQEGDSQSPLRTKHYMKTLNGESPDEASLAKKSATAGGTLDFTKAELPFTNFASVQETREINRMDQNVAETITTSQGGETRPGHPSISDYYSLAKRQNVKQDV